jgi:hypothetical protein
VRLPPLLILAIATGLTPACKSTCAPGTACETDAAAPDTGAIPELSIVIDRTQADLGQVRLGATSPPAAFTIANRASGTTGTLQAIVTGDGFALAGDPCLRALAPAERCTVNVVFRPTMAGARGGTLVVSATPGGTLTAALSGVGVTELDAGADGSADPTDATSVGACDPAKQDCPAGQTCDLICSGLASRILCRPVPAGGGVAVGQSCTGIKDDCAFASGCYQTVNMPESCIRYCASDADCGPGTTCQSRTVIRSCPSGAQFMLKFCLP